MPLNPLPIPLDTPLVNEDRTIEFSLWVPFFVARDQQLAASSQLLVDKQLAAQSASIGATPLNIGTSAGLYRVSVVTRITVAASVSSSLTPTIRWTTGGVALSRTYTALTGNTTTTNLVDTFPIRIDSNTAVTYETAYVSAGTPMQYALEVAVERLA